MALQPRLTTTAVYHRPPSQQGGQVSRFETSHHANAHSVPSATSRSSHSTHGGVYKCSICESAFPLRKSLLRHVRSAHRSEDAIQFRCSACDLICSRQDILSRHVKTQHREDGRRIQCERCLKYVRQRSLPFHHASAACQETSANIEVVQVGVNGTTYLPSDDMGYSFPTFQLPPFTDAALLSAWLFAKLRPWGQNADTAQSWSGVPRPTTTEVLQLKGMVYSAIITALSASDVSTSPHLPDAIAILIVVTTMTEGWGACLIHTQGFVRLAAVQIDAALGSWAQFAKTKPMAALEQVLLAVVPGSEVPRCQRILTMTLELMRLSAIEVIYAPSRYTGPPASMPPVWTRVFLHTSEEWFQRYRPQLDAITEVALSVSGESPALQEPLFHVAH